MENFVKFMLHFTPRILVCFAVLHFLGGMTAYAYQMTTTSMDGSVSWAYLLLLGANGLLYQSGILLGLGGVVYYLRKSSQAKEGNA